VDSYGAPRYPELVLVTTHAFLRRSRGTVRSALLALEDGTRAALRDPEPVIADIARRAQAAPSLIRAELAAIHPALVPPVSLSPRAIGQWARFDVRFGILRRAPDLGRAFDFGVAR